MKKISQNNNFSKKMSAFTLLELVAVIAVVGVLVVGVLVFSKGIISSVKNFKEKYPSYSNITTETEPALTVLSLDGTSLDNVVYGDAFDVTLENNKIKVVPNGVGTQSYIMFDIPIDTSKDFSAVWWSTTNAHHWFTNDPNIYSSSISGGDQYFYIKKWGVYHVVLHKGPELSIIINQNITPVNTLTTSLTQIGMTYEAETRSFKTYWQGSQMTSHTLSEANALSGNVYLKFTGIDFSTNSGQMFIDSVLIDTTKALSGAEISALYSQGP